MNVLYAACFVHIGLINTPWAIWLPTVANAFNIFLLKRFFDSIPEELMAAAAIDVHYSIPDSADGSAYTAPLAVYVNGGHTQDLTLTNRYSWFYGSYPFTNSPGGNPHHFYDDVRTTFAATLPAGTRVRFQVDSGSTPVTVDTADFEQIAPPAQPSGSLSVTGYGADPTGAADATGAFTTALAAASAQGRVLWVPAGRYIVTAHLIVNNVTVQGAGPWYSVLAVPGGRVPRPCRYPAPPTAPRSAPWSRRRATPSIRPPATRRPSRSPRPARGTCG